MLAATRCRNRAGGDDDEVKAKPRVAVRDLKGLRALAQETRLKRAIVVSLEERPRRVEQVEILPWREFLERLWGGELAA
jgi:uncharacterized protein